MHIYLTVYYTVLYYIAPTYFDANASSSGICHSVTAKLHKRVRAVLVVLTFRHRASSV